MLSRGAGIPVPVPFVGDPFTAPSLRLAYAVWGYPAEQGAEWTGSAWDRRAARAGDGRDIKRRLCPMLGRCAAAMHVKSHCRSNQHGQIPGEIRWRVKWGRRGRQGRGESGIGLAERRQLMRCLLHCGVADAARLIENNWRGSNGALWTRCSLDCACVHAALRQSSLEATEDW